jgi:hypothetical protein
MDQIAADLLQSSATAVRARRGSGRQALRCHPRACPEDPSCHGLRASKLTLTTVSLRRGKTVGLRPTASAWPEPLRSEALRTSIELRSSPPMTRIGKSARAQHSCCKSAEHGEKQREHRNNLAFDKPPPQKKLVIATISVLTFETGTADTTSGAIATPETEGCCVSRSSPRAS